MSAASNYTENNIINSLLRGAAFPVPAQTYVSLHTSNPGEDGGNEVNTSAWPSYRRIQAEGGGAIGTGWAAPNDGVTSNSLQILFPSHNGSGAVTVTHWSIYDAETGGNMLVYAPLNTARTLIPGDLFAVDVGALTVSAA